MSPIIIGPFKATIANYNGEERLLDFCDEKFKIDTSVGGMPLLEFADAAANGVDASEMAGLAAMHSMIKDCLEPGEWDRFRQCAKKNKAPISLLMEVCSSIYAALSARPITTDSSSPVGSLTSGSGQDSKPTSSLSDSVEADTWVLAGKKPANG